MSDIFLAMDVRPGATVADIGAGDGSYDSFGRRGRPTGRVLAVDVSDDALDRLRRRLRLGEEPRASVAVVNGLTTDPNLPVASVDAHR